MENQRKGAVEDHVEKEHYGMCVITSIHSKLPPSTLFLAIERGDKQQVENLLQ